MEQNKNLKMLNIILIIEQLKEIAKLNKIIDRHFVIPETTAIQVYFKQEKFPYYDKLEDMDLFYCIFEKTWSLKPLFVWPTQYLLELQAKEQLDPLYINKIINHLNNQVTQNSLLSRNIKKLEYLLKQLKENLDSYKIALEKNQIISKEILF
ncbi:Uncharacterised protein [Mesomycoplasma conjunctivae]|uniref:Uncharacterized protein n=1 Tax=Mesomycoplasma conjunctivae (strain ATCC 25834 / NCTC 10147 / HRC/581) TaxID=572263 RepID=C5J6U0_MESCH|nr:hypothetical protein [Mesomycoplasma conjunctivae]CAT05203.1 HYPOTHETICAL PROTEIN MCJ_004980 [Mesomycoplasma conjunctivae]VEU66414.1 Uncharacterised protein [Mesomycoplasma conjunctivae]